MANVRWIGGATAVAQVDTFTPGGTIEATDVFILTVTDKADKNGRTCVISAAAGGTTPTDVVTALKAAWNASTDPLCTPVTASGTATLILTADTAGIPFSVAGTTTETGGGAADDQTFVRAATVASAGPSHWDTAANWDSGVVPGGAASQDVYIENSASDIIYGLDQSGISETLNSLNIGKSFTGRIGYNGATGYSGTYLVIKASSVNIGQHSGIGSPAGSGRIMIDTTSTASTITIYDTSSSPSDTNKPSCRLKAASASTVINIKKGKVGIAYESGETTTIGTINQSFVSDQSADASVYIGAGVTLTTYTKTGGSAVLGCAATTVTNSIGTLQTIGAGAIATFNITGGIVTSNSVGTITALNVISGIADFTGSQSARTVTMPKVGAGGQIKYDPSIVTMTNKIQPYLSSGNIAISGISI